MELSKYRYEVDHSTLQKVIAQQGLSEWRFPIYLAIFIQLCNVGLAYEVVAHLLLREYAIGSGQYKGCRLQGRVDFQLPSFLAASFLM